MRMMRYIIYVVNVVSSSRVTSNQPTIYVYDDSSLFTTILYHTSDGEQLLKTRTFPPVGKPPPRLVVPAPAARP